jgi:ppGpp synthetase/RelA/SpoT-type nucleotidyltranferase
MVEQVDIERRTRELRTWYEGHRYKCSAFQQRFVRHVERALRNAGLVDFQLESRTKGVDSYVDKALKQLPTGGFKYLNPYSEITDAVGIRILVPLGTDLAPVSTVLKRTYLMEEELHRGEEEGHIDVPGYRSLHFLVRLKDEDAADVDFREFSDMVAEVQVRTTLQHAWATLQHDLMYKTERPPSPAIRRRLIALAGLLELADREFVSVRQAHGETRDEASAELVAGGGRLTASALRHIAENLLGEEDPAAQDWFVSLAQAATDLGIETPNQLYERLGSWRGRAPEVAAAVRLTKPWVNSAYVLDLLLRLAMREGYFEKRPPYDEEHPMDAEDVAHSRRLFLTELDMLERTMAES